MADDRNAPAWRRAGFGERHAGPWLAVLALLTLLPFLAGLVPIVRFERERIDVALYPTEVQVVGWYVYRNPWPVSVSQGLAVPLPVDAGHPMPTELIVARGGPGASPLPVRSFLGRHTFEVRFQPGEELEVMVRYRQFAPRADARYLLTTTQPWRRPLEHGRYTLTLHDTELLTSNYALHRETATLYTFERTRFLPEADWRFAWRRR